MKTAKEWRENWPVYGNIPPTEVIEEIQRDALLHAAEICHNLGHGKLHLENQYSCEEAIRAAAMPNEKS
jgi:hypothetical protein